MAAGDLTTLDNVKQWRTPAIASTDDDTQLSREITAASKAILQVVQRASLALASYTENRNGQGTDGMMLRNYPVVAISSVTVEGGVIPPALTQSTAGWVFSPDDGMLYLRGFLFTTGFQNVQVVYTAGLAQLDLQMTIDGATYKVECSDLSELWASNGSVVFTDGSGTLTPVKTTPGVGEYVPPTGPDGFYLFTMADGGGEVDIFYGYTPKDVEEACMDTVILEYNRRGRIGENSKVLAGENINYYNTKAFTETILSRLNNYTNVVPNL